MILKTIPIPGVIIVLGSPNSEGISEQDFVEEVESKNSLEDALLSRPIVLKYDLKNIIVVTSDYHFERAKYIFEKVFSNLAVTLKFSICKTNENTCDIDLKSHKKHEKEAIIKLKSDNYFKQ
ncbi:MAG: YdcF family protein [bacterium]